MVRSLVTNLYSANLHMTNLRTDEMVFFRNLTKVDTDENKTIYIISNAEFSANTSLFIFVISCDFKDYVAAHNLQMLLLSWQIRDIGRWGKHCAENHTNHVLRYRKLLLDDKSGMRKYQTSSRDDIKPLFIRHCFCNDNIKYKRTDVLSLWHQQ